MSTNRRANLSGHLRRIVEETTFDRVIRVAWLLVAIALVRAVSDLPRDFTVSLYGPGVLNDPIRVEIEGSVLHPVQIGIDGSLQVGR